MKLGYHTGYWSSGPPAGAVEAIAEAERLGFESMWTAEAYGSDCLTPLAWWGAATSRIKLGTALVQLSARTREYISILRDIWRREGPVTAPGPHYELPLPGGTGLAKPLKSSIHPLRS